MPQFLIRRLEERTIKCLRIDSTLDSQVKIDIFERLNSGSVKLEPQELRNAVYGGKFNILCKLLALNKDFRKLLQIDDKDPLKSMRVKKMEDVELVLRFFTLIDDNYINYKKSKDKGFANFLSETMEKKKNISEDDAKELTLNFEKTMKIIRRDFGDVAFAKYKVDEKSKKLVSQSKFNVAVFDALATSCHDLIFEQGIESFAKKRNSFLHLFKTPEFYESISGSYLDTAKLKYRIEQTKAALI